MEVGGQVVLATNINECGSPIIVCMDVHTKQQHPQPLLSGGDLRDPSEKLEEFWSTMDDIDRHLLVVDPRQASRATTYRRVDLNDELEDQSGSPPDYTCDNPNCSRAVHSLCLRDWLRSITTTRQ
ncbi:hypothetical protein QJS10_CPA05g01680 [Acorus calamus]|uniref:Uncharacterized protein n=1 Tax=Acorus calamus TaxID=4465 RepID=A0AAV9EYP7_ACOCL|nr:hypothetical protein QJS10_CPA05g01680 [Acorus calamus]